MDIHTLRSLTDDDLREKLEENGYNPPPITDGAVRELLRRKLFKFLNPNEKYPDEDETGDAEVEGSDEEENDEEEVEIRERKHFGEGDAPVTPVSRSSPNTDTESERGSSIPTFVVVCFIIMNISLAICIFYRDWLF